LIVNERLIGEGELPKVANRHGVEPFEVGRDSISPVSTAYGEKGSFSFTRAIEKISFTATPTGK
jgi:arylsulfatase